jgi:hypothetical protein
MFIWHFSRLRSLSIDTKPLDTVCTCKSQCTYVCSEGSPAQALRKSPGTRRIHVWLRSHLYLLLRCRLKLNVINKLYWICNKYQHMYVTHRNFRWTFSGKYTSDKSNPFSQKSLLKLLTALTQIGVAFLYTEQQKAISTFGNVIITLHQLITNLLRNSLTLVSLHELGAATQNETTSIQI